MAEKIKAHELRDKKKGELQSHINELKTELSSLRVAQVKAPNPSKLAKIRTVRRAIARALTVVNQTQKTSLRRFYQDKAANQVPLDLRVKKTRAIRRQLTKKQQNAVTLRTQKINKHFPQRVFAVKA
ncbi:S60 ribosomal protein L35 [Tieghemostelium lacteum]|uniref:S60 ribosomal protein L35 n=1 Tax=Tieghemostelium lacteum TaxID=361077 RepID=A0A152A6G9_TIELA|nr:S60 ribosomal protein L35 [Tieghemostelium lacteum]|eukprot:KYR01822.1 S60 ribosomal protein L35 [Tieghemostelium lacteum]